MKLIQLKIFCNIASTKSFVSAAQMNYMTQPSVSAHIKQLEEELGVRLFDRVPRRVLLTPEGKIYLQHAEEILRKCNRLLSLSRSFSESPKGEIRIASIHSIGMYELGPFLKGFMEKHPGIQIHLEYHEVSKVYELVKKKKVHMGIVAYPEKHLDIVDTTYGIDKLTLIVCSAHHLASRKKIPPVMLSDEPFIGFDQNTPTREHIDQFLIENKINIRMNMTSNNIFALKKAVEAGLGISIVPWSTVDEEVQRGTIHRVELIGLDLERPLSIITMKSSSISQVTRLFMNGLIAYGSHEML